MREEGGREVDYLLEEKNLFSNGFWKKHKVTFSTPAAESHGLWPWMNAPSFGRDVAPQGR
jgi:hypothetical protein